MYLNAVACYRVDAPNQPLEQLYRRLSMELRLKLQ